MSSFLIGPCLRVILPADSSILVTWPLTIGDWATVTLGSTAPKRTRILAATRIILRMDCLLFCFCSCASLHDDLAEHALFVVAGDETGEFEFTALGELPNELAVPIRQNALPVRVVVLHVGMFFHDLRVLAIFGNRREDEFVILLAIVAQNETDLLSSAHFDSRGLEAHFSAALEHPDLDDARRLLRVAGLAGGEASVILVGEYRRCHRDTRREDYGARRAEQ